MSETREPASLNIHLLQFEITAGQVESNLAKADGMLEGVETTMGDIVLLPEMFSSGFFNRDLASMADLSERALEWMAAKSKQWGIFVAGSVPVKRKTGIANSMVLFGTDGSMAGSYDKIHLFPLTGEDTAFIRGDRTVVLDCGGTRAGLLLCFDLRYPEISRRLCLDGAQMILVSAQWPASRVEHFYDLVRVRAMENQLFVAAANACGDDGSGYQLGGRSICAGPMGEVTGMLGDKKGVLSVTVLPGEVERVRREFPVLSLRRPGSY